jgi:hypothetical protein
MVEKITSVASFNDKHQNMGKYDESMDEVERIKMLSQ